MKIFLTCFFIILMSLQTASCMAGEKQNWLVEWIHTNLAESNIDHKRGSEFQNSYSNKQWDSNEQWESYKSEMKRKKGEESGLFENFLKRSEKAL